MGAGAARQMSNLLLLFLVAGASALAGCSDYPKDVQDTLNGIRQDGVLLVGVIENPPWVIRGESGPEGLEPEIVQSLANQLNAEVRWRWGSTAELIHTLEQRQLHLVIGGLTTGPRLPKTVAATRPFYTSRYTVGFPQDRSGMPSTLEGQPVALPVVSPMYEILKEADAEPRPMDTPRNSELPLAGPTWKLEAHGYTAGQWELLNQKHVMIVTPGENAWLVRLQQHLNGLTGLDERLRQLEDPQ